MVSSSLLRTSRRVCVKKPASNFSHGKTVERLQQIIWEEHEPKRMIETPVYDLQPNFQKHDLITGEQLNGGSGSESSRDGGGRQARAVRGRRAASPS